jgi:hypothetical protein
MTLQLFDFDRSEIDDRFYNALYKKLSEPEWKHSKMLSTFLNLIFKSMLKDVMESRIRVGDDTHSDETTHCVRRRSSNVCYNCVYSTMCRSSVEFFFSSLNCSNGIAMDPNYCFEHKKHRAWRTATNWTKMKRNIFTMLSVTMINHFKRCPILLRGTTKSFAQQTKVTLYCGADLTCVHELLFLKHHSHPTVALFAQNLLDVSVGRV